MHKELDQVRAILNELLHVRMISKTSFKFDSACINNH